MHYFTEAQATKARNANLLGLWNNWKETPMTNSFRVMRSCFHAERYCLRRSGAEGSDTKGPTGFKWCVANVTEQQVG